MRFLKNTFARLLNKDFLVKTYSTFINHISLRGSIITPQDFSFVISKPLSDSTGKEDLDNFVTYDTESIVNFLNLHSMHMICSYLDDLVFMECIHGSLQFNLDVYPATQLKALFSLGNPVIYTKVVSSENIALTAVLEGWRYTFNLSYPKLAVRLI